LSRDLRLYTALQIALGFGALALVTALIPIDERIRIDAPGAPPSIGVVLGLLFWIALALAGSSLVSERPQGVVLTYDLPFIAAATVLGGPVAGGWVAMVGSFELRELRGGVPWYGALANHSVTAFPAIVAGLALLLIEPVWVSLGATGSAGHDLLTTLLVVAVMAVLTGALAVETLALRSDRSFGEVAADFGLGYRVTTVGEAILAWLMVEVFLLVGWWTPIVCLAAILAIWKGFDVDQALEGRRRDGLTGLWNETEYVHRLEQALGQRPRAGRRVVTVLIELEGLALINRRLGQDDGDEVLRLIGRRLRGSLRPADQAARLGAGTFAALLVVRDSSAAHTVAWRIHKAITAPADLRSGPIEIRASIGIAVGSATGLPARGNESLLATSDEADASARATLAKARRVLRRAELRGTGVEVDGSDD
jgi:diguanylate cyclase (GGDEF)-like protein